MERYVTLLRDYGYKFTGDTLIERGIRGHTSDRVVGTFANAMAAAEHICPIIHDEEFTRRLASFSADN